MQDYNFWNVVNPNNFENRFCLQIMLIPLPLPKLSLIISKMVNCYVHVFMDVMEEAKNGDLCMVWISRYMLQPWLLSTRFGFSVLLPPSFVQVNKII